MPSRCLPSKFLTSLESNTIYMGKSLQNKYECPDSLCGEIGSFSRPAQTFSEVIRIIEKNYKNVPVSLSIFSGTYKEDSILEYNVPSNLISIYGISPKNTNLSGSFRFTDSIEIKNITLEGLFTSIIDKDIIIKNCSIILLEQISLENQKNIEFIDSTIIGSILYKNNLSYGTSIVYKNCILESLGNTINLFELENDSSISFSIENSSFSTNFSSGTLKTFLKDNSTININILNSKLLNSNQENYSIELVGESLSNTTFSILSSFIQSKCNFMYKYFLNDSNITYRLENNNFELENQMHKKELINNGIYRETLKNNNVYYLNSVPLNKPLCDIKKIGGQYFRTIEGNNMRGNTEKDIPLMLKSHKDTILDTFSKGNTFTNNGLGDGIINNHDNTILSHIGDSNIFNIKYGISFQTNLINNSKVDETRENILMQSKQGFLMNTDTSSSMNHIYSNLKYRSNETMDKEYHNKLNGNIKSIFTTSTFSVENSDKNIAEINGGEHNFSNTSLTHNDRGDIFSIKDSNILCSTSNLLSREGRSCSLSGKSNININTSQIIRAGTEEKSVIEQKDETNTEISASNISNTLGHCIEKLGENTNTTCNAVKTKINENYNIIQGGGQFTQSDSQCLIGSSKTNIPPVNVPSSVTL